jgi:hypothetical protein
MSLMAQVDRGVIKGTIVDEFGLRVNSVKVQVYSELTGYDRTVVTSDGQWIVPNLSVGNYTISITKEGFTSSLVKNQKLSVGQTLVIDTVLVVGGIDTSIDVISETAEIQTSNAEIGSVVQSEQIKNIPLNGRHWASLMALAPGAVSVGGEGNQNSIRFFGRPRDDNNWTFDGVDATGIKDPRQEGNLRLVISTDSIAEFVVNSLPFTAESGVGGGAQINLVSKTGTNEFHGTAYNFFRNSALDARRPFDGENPPPFKLNQFGANFGGKLIKDKTFFFTNYEGMEQRLTISRADGLVPSSTFRQTIPQSLRELVSAFPVGNVTENSNADRLIAQTPEIRKESSGLVRVDHKITDNHTLYGRLSITDGFVSQIRNGLLERRDSYIRPSNMILGTQQIWNPNLINEIKLGVNRSALTRNDVGLFTEGISIPGFTSTQPTTYIVEKPTSYSIVNNAVWNKSNHTIKFGGETRRIHMNVGNGSATTIAFANIDAFQKNSINRISVSGQLPTVGVRRSFNSVYIQDEFKIKSNLTMNIGIRYEHYTVSKDSFGRGRVFDLYECAGFCPDNTRWFSPDRNNIAPRISFAWNVVPKLVIRGGYGRYFGPGQNDDVTAAIDSIPENFGITSADFPNLSYPVNNLYSILKTSGQTPRSLQRDRKEPESHMWTLNIQREILPKTILQVAYVGNVGRNQLTRTYVNTLNPITRIRPLSNFNQIDEKRFDGVTSFNGLQSSLTKSMHKNLLFGIQYMWGRVISDNAGSGEGGQIQDVTCRTCDKGDADYDIRHTMTVNWVYAIPVWRSKPYGGWDFSGIFTQRTGMPFSVTISRSASTIPSGQTQNQRANYNGLPVYLGRPDAWINPDAFTLPLPGTYGNSGRNAFRGPGLWQSDVSLSKSTNLTESFKLSLRIDAFNLFNRSQYGNPVSVRNNSTFGRILSTVNDGSTGTGTSRQLQLSARLTF